MKGKLIWSIFWALVGVFIIVFSTITWASFWIFYVTARAKIIPPVRFDGLIYGVILIGLGVALIVLTVKIKVRGRHKKFLLLTGASAMGLPLFAVLHNLVSELLNIEELVFLFITTILCPISFLVGAAGTIVLASKTKPSIPTGTS